MPRKLMHRHEIEAAMRLHNQAAGLALDRLTRAPFWRIRERRAAQMDANAHALCAREFARALSGHNNALSGPEATAGSGYARKAGSQEN